MEANEVDKEKDKVMLRLSLLALLKLFLQGSTCDQMVTTCTSTNTHTVSPNIMYVRFLPLIRFFFERCKG